MFYARAYSRAFMITFMFDLFRSEFPTTFIHDMVYAYRALGSFIEGWLSYPEG